MKVLTVLGVLVAAGFIYWLTLKINSITYKKYKYELFYGDSIFIVAAGYALLIWGYIWFTEALAKQEDILNGILILAFGIIALLIQTYINIKNTKFVVGIFLTIIQFLIYIPILVGLGIVLLGLVMLLSETKPVYNLNK